MSSSPYDPELPFLAELEQVVRTQALRAAADAEAGRSAHPLRAPNTRATRPRLRSLRRVALLATLLCAAATTAFGTREIFFTSSPPPGLQQSAPVQLSVGSSGADRWSLQIYTRGRDLCRELILQEVEVTSRCMPAPPTAGLGATSAASATRRYVFGLAGQGVSAVRVESGSQTQTTHTRAVGAGFGRGGRGAQLRYFVAVLPRPLDAPDAKASATPLNGAGRQAGPAQASCLPAAEVAGCN